MRLSHLLVRATALTEKAAPSGPHAVVFRRRAQGLIAEGVGVISLFEIWQGNRNNTSRFIE
jgi:hypothetical protein